MMDEPIRLDELKSKALRADLVLYVLNGNWQEVGRILSDLQEQNRKVILKHLLRLDEEEPRSRSKGLKRRHPKSGSPSVSLTSSDLTERSTAPEPGQLPGKEPQNNDEDCITILDDEPGIYKKRTLSRDSDGQNSVVRSPKTPCKDPKNSGRYSVLPTPTEDNPYAGCPGNDVDSNWVKGITEHETRAKLSIRFLVEFVHHPPRWVDARTVLNLEPKGPLKEYLCRWADVSPRAYINNLQKHPFMKLFCEEYGLPSIEEEDEDEDEDEDEEEDTE